MHEKPGQGTDASPEHTIRELDIRLARGEISERAYKGSVRRLNKELEFMGND